MGYDHDGKGTLVYVPEKHKVISTGDFIFDELVTVDDIQSTKRMKPVTHFILVLLSLYFGPLPNLNHWILFTLRV